MSTPISIQLYSLREQMEGGRHLDILGRLAEVGYTGVEPAGLYGMQPAEFRKVVEDLGMTISSNHGPMPGKENKNEILDLYAGLGCKWVVAGFGPDDFKDLDSIKRSADRANEAIDALEGAGLTFVLHNHWWEFETIDGKVAYEHFLPLVPKARLEIDTYWAANFGANDVPAYVSKFKSIAPLLHLKDGPLEMGQAMTAVGDGKAPVPEVVAAADPSVLEWCVVELDQCATDMFEAVAKSYRYLVGKGICSGRRPV